MFFEDSSFHSHFDSYSQLHSQHELHSPPYPYCLPLHPADPPPPSPRPSPSTRTLPNKNRPIKKGRRKRESGETGLGSGMGRPSNEGIELLHLQESKRYNDIVYHNARWQILLKLKQGKETRVPDLRLTPEETNWFTQTQQLMTLDLFPQQGSRNLPFLLHPSSLHFVFQRFKQVHNWQTYSSQQVRAMLLACLKIKGLLTTSTFNYIRDYWEDIVTLVNQPDGSLVHPQDSPEQPRLSEDSSKERPTAVKLPSSQGTSSRTDTEGGWGSGGGCVRATTRSGRRKSELQQLRDQLQQDDSIAAYQIACYLHACCLRFWLTISSGIDC